MRSPALSFSLRRQVALLSRRDVFSEDFIRLSAYTLGSMLLLFFFVSMFFFWNISREKASFAQQQLVHEALSQEQVTLKAKRDKLVAKSRMVALAAAQLDLHLPEKGQEHYLY
jgi:hypothetical protein